MNPKLEKYSKYVDKYKVREIITKKIGNQYLVPLLGVWDDPNKIDFDKLPNKFVLKSTHGSQQVFICKDKSEINKNQTIHLLKGWLKDDFYKKTREIQYKKCDRNIIAEKYIENNDRGLIDYKFYCFNGEPYVILVVNDRFIKGSAKYYFVDLEWNMNEYFYKGYKGNLNTLPEKPKHLEKMIEIAKKLSKGFAFVRVDLYLVKDQIYFGELTFIPSGGLDPYHPKESEYELGALLDINLIK
jgi:hypothetical protein